MGRDEYCSFAGALAVSDRVLVCGGRSYQGDVSHALDRLDIGLIIHGAAWGADMAAESWAKRRSVAYVGVPAEWGKYGKAAGPMRNTRMLKDWGPDLVVAFPGDIGTADMVKKAKVAGIKIIEVSDD